MMCPADLDKLQQEEVAHICEWLTEKVDSYSTRLNPEPKDEPEEVRRSCHYYPIMPFYPRHEAPSRCAGSLPDADVCSSVDCRGAHCVPNRSAESLTRADSWCLV